MRPIGYEEVFVSIYLALSVYLLRNKTFKWKIGCLKPDSVFFWKTYLSNRYPNIDSYLAWFKMLIKSLWSTAAFSTLNKISFVAGFPGGAGPYRSRTWGGNPAPRKPQKVPNSGSSGTTSVRPRQRPRGRSCANGRFLPCEAAALCLTQHLVLDPSVSKLLFGLLAPNPFHWLTSTCDWLPPIDFLRCP